MPLIRKHTHISRLPRYKVSSDVKSFIDDEEGWTKGKIELQNEVLSSYLLAESGDDYTDYTDAEDLKVTFDKDMTAITVKDEDDNCCSVFKPKCEVVRKKTEEIKKCKVYLSKKMLCDGKNTLQKGNATCSQMKTYARIKAAKQNKQKAKKYKKAKKGEKNCLKLGTNKGWLLSRWDKIIYSEGANAFSQKNFPKPREPIQQKACKIAVILVLNMQFIYVILPI